MAEEEIKKREEEIITEKILCINRVSKVTKGGKKLSFSALVVVGNGKGKVGFALGKANEVADAIRKGILQANRQMITVPLKGDTIPHMVIGQFSAAKILLKPASEGTGVIAGGPVRAVCDACGIKDILSKSLKSNNPINVVTATIKALANLKRERTLYESESNKKTEASAEEL